VANTQILFNDRGEKPEKLFMHKVPKIMNGKDKINEDVGERLWQNQSMG